MTTLCKMARPTLPAPHSPDLVLSFPHCHMTYFTYLFASWLAPLQHQLGEGRGLVLFIAVSLTPQTVPGLQEAFDKYGGMNE